MAAKRKFNKATVSAGIIGWVVALLMFFPILWMLLAAFKTEIDAVAPPKLFFSPTLENFTAVNQRADYFRYAMNSVVESLGATILSLVIAVPAAYAAAFFRASVPGSSTLDAFDKNASSSGCFGADLSARSRQRNARYAHGPHHHLHIVQSADCRLDALFLLQGSAP